VDIQAVAVLLFVWGIPEVKDAQGILDLKEIRVDIQVQQVQQRDTPGP
jgi:hypothetical protein